jgi:hypothetical protein
MNTVNLLHRTRLITILLIYFNTGFNIENLKFVNAQVEE